MQPVELDYGVVPSGTTEMRMFRVDNGTPDDVLFTSATIGSSHFAIETVRYETDPGDPNAFLRVPLALPRRAPPASRSGSR